LRESAPRCEVQLLGVLELRQIIVESRPFGQQAENTPLVEHVDMVLPDHVVDRAKPAAVSDQQRGQACDAIAHHLTSGSGMVSANPARNTGCAKPSGATLAADPRGVASAYSTEPPTTIWICFFNSPEPAGLSTRPPRASTVWLPRRQSTESASPGVN